jgi:hypothetical protein
MKVIIQSKANNSTLLIRSKTNTARMAHSQLSKTNYSFSKAEREERAYNVLAVGRFGVHCPGACKLLI